jgi:hypothetical protein
MANTPIQIKRSLVSNTPVALNIGEPAYSYSSNTLFIGSPAENGAIAIGGYDSYVRGTSSYNHTNSAFNTANAAFVRANNSLNVNTGGVISGDITIQGNLNIVGGAIGGNTPVVMIGDNIISLNTAINQSAQPTMNAGIEIDRGAQPNVYLLWNETGNKWQFTNDGTNYDDLGGSATASYANSAFIKANASFDHANASFAAANNVFPQIQPAFNTANSGFIQANAAFVHANAAFAAANNVFPQVQPAYDTANAAFIHANSAFIQTNASFAHANAAYISQNATGQYTNSAFTLANANFAHANSGFDHANAAFVKANSAYESQNSSGEYANAAFTVANGAFIHANSGFIQANAAYRSQNATGNVANAAFANANGAFAAANAAFANANGAFARANAAFANANGAFAMANVSFNTANAAFIRANNSLNANVGGQVTGDVVIVGNVTSNTLTTTGSNGSITGANAIFTNYIFAANGNVDLYIYSSLAYAQSNAALAAANAAFANANAAFAGANSAFANANGAFAAANAAYIHANSGFIQANASFGHANAAYLSQNATGQYANAAFIWANAAYNQANTDKANLVNSGNTAQLYSNGVFGLPGNLLFQPSKARITNQGDGLLSITANAQSGNTGIYLDNAGQAVLYGKTGVLIQTNQGLFDSPTKSFTFDDDGTITLPGSSGQIGRSGYPNGIDLYNNNGGTGYVRMNYADQSVIWADPGGSHIQAAGTYTWDFGTDGQITFPDTTKQNTAFIGYGIDNVARDSTNSAFIHANSAFIHSNSAYESQNATGQYANAAFIRANNSIDANGGGVITGNLTVTQNLSVGNLFVTGQVVSINASTLVSNDTLIILGSGNYFSDLKDLGFAGHYNDGTNAHSGLIRDAGTKEWHLFKGYTPEIGGENNVDINDPSFITDTLHANLRSTFITIKNIDILPRTNIIFDLTNASFIHANSGFVHANAAYQSQNATGQYANAAFIHANAAFIAANSAAGTYANAAFLHANSAYESQNATGQYANAAFIQANTGYNLANSIANNSVEAGTANVANYVRVESKAGSRSYNVALLDATTGNLIIGANTGLTYHPGLQTVFAQLGSFGQSVTTSSILAASLIGVIFNTTATTIRMGGAATTVNIGNAGGTTNVFGTLAVNGVSVIGFTRGAYDTGNSAFIQANASFNHANAAFAAANNVAPQVQPSFDTANAAFIQANGAIVHAQSAFNAQNTTGQYANAAYNHANAAFNSANNVAPQVQPAFNTANAAFIHANSAYADLNTVSIYANTPSYTANSAAIYANGAFAQANIANNNANSASVYANASFIVANSGFIQANSAFFHANDAYNAANAGFAAANSGGTYANSAFATANSGSQYANSAFVHANSGFIQANSAYAHANAAFNSANNVAPQVQPAFDTANAAFIQANSSFIHANAAFNAANNASDPWVRGQANAAFIQANAAFDKANTGANAEVSTFTTTANGSVSTFALGFAPASNSAVIVSIGGIVQSEFDDYVVTRTNNSISFNEPPPAGEKIRVAGFNNVVPYFLDVANSAGAVVSTYNNIGDGISTAFNVGFRPESDKAIFVSIGGILQPESAYSVNPSTNTVTFGTAPGDGENIRVVGFEKINPYFVQNIYINSNVSVSVFETTSNGNFTTFDLGFNPQAKETLLVTVDGVVQPLTSYSVNPSANSITFTEAPVNGELVRVATFYTAANTIVIPDGSVTTAKLSSGVNSTINGAYNHANSAFNAANTAASTGKAIAMALVFGG